LNSNRYRVIRISVLLYIVGFTGLWLLAGPDETVHGITERMRSWLRARWDEDEHPSFAQVHQA